MHRIAIIIYGPPGSGKSTQVDLAAGAYDLVRFDTGKFIERVIYDPAHANDAMVQAQRTRYEQGVLCDKPWVFNIVSTNLTMIMNAGFGVALSGSPRTTYEAFDAPGRLGIYSMLAQHYGKEHIYTFLLTVKKESSVHRNTHRQMCSVCNRQYVYQPECTLQRCPFCSGPLRARTDDKPETIKERLEQFELETMPILKELPKLGYVVHGVDGELFPYQVFEKIIHYIK